MALSVAGAIGLSALVFHQPLMDGAARFLVHSDPPQQSALMYILGGNYEVRAPFAAALFRAGWAPKILISREQDASHGGANFSDITRQILIANGVPPDRIVAFAPNTGVRSTADEARALRLYLDVYPASKVLVVTSAFHSRRARMAMMRAVPSGISVSVVPVTDPNCNLVNWQGSGFCRHEVESEWEKFVFYFFTFFG